MYYKWNISYSPNQKSERNIDHNRIEAPLNFKYGQSSSWESWISFGNWIYALNKGRDILPDSEKEKIDNLTNGINDNETKAKILYYHMEDYTRYINVAVKIGGLQTYPAEDVCVNRYGDCKALTNYIISLIYMPIFFEILDIKRFLF